MTEYPPPPGDPNRPHYGLPPEHQYPYGGTPYGGAPGQAPGSGPYDERYGYGPPGVSSGPRTQVTGDDTTWALMSYVGSLLVGFLAPLVIYFVKRRESAFIRHHAAQALNYQLTVLIQMLAPLLLAIPLAILMNSPVWFLLVLPPVLFHAIAQWVFLILGSVRASQSQYYRFPTWTCFRMIR